MAIIHSKDRSPRVPRALANPVKPITAAEILEKLGRTRDWGSILIPEFTWGSLRADAIVLDINQRWIRAFEIKVSRSDFLGDDKWQLYSQFCSSLAVACPEGLIKPEEVPAPFGLIWFKRSEFGFDLEYRWVKKAKVFQHRKSMAWLWTYLQVLETEFPRLQAELAVAKDRLKRQEGAS